MKKTLIVGAHVLITLAFGAYCFFLGSVTQTTTYESDLALCKAACEPNGGCDRMRTSFYCTCENGATFDDSDLRP